MTPPNLDSTAAAEHFFAGAVAAGMTTVIVSPGSRSTPLTIAADRTPGLTMHLHLDERCAAFAALGQAKLSGRTVGLVCTSGTAAANYLPALSEASLSNVPLVAITADRPPEHQHIGVGQSFDQRGLFHAQVRDEITMPVGPDGGADFTLRAGWRAVATAVERHGPVHVNWSFRLPLEPRGGAIVAPQTPDAVLAPAYDADPRQREQLLDRLSSAVRPLIVAGPNATGPHRSPTEAGDVVRVASALGIPVLSDVLSGLRGLRSPAIVDAPALVVETPLPNPDLIIRLGDTPTSKATRLWWESVDAPQLLIDPHDDWQDPSSAHVTRLRCSGASLLRAVENDALAVEHGWLDAWVAAGQRAASARQDVLSEFDELTEAHIAASLGEAPGGHDLVVASSSMPIRDLDSFVSIDSPVSVWSNRGINGIDGVISTAIGASRTASGRRILVHLGDIAALHDIGGLLDAARQGIDMTIVIPNNDGGGIFSFLPARTSLDAAQFDALFHTPHGTTFDYLAGYPGVHHQRITSDLSGALEHVSNVPGVSIVEVPVSTATRLELRDRLRGRLSSV